MSLFSGSSPLEWSPARSGDTLGMRKMGSWVSGSTSRKICDPKALNSRWTLILGQTLGLYGFPVPVLSLRALMTQETKWEEEGNLFR